MIPLANLPNCFAVRQFEGRWRIGAPAPDFYCAPFTKIVSTRTTIKYKPLPPGGTRLNFYLMLSERRRTFCVLIVQIS
jgi:hypothetical protein